MIERAGVTTFIETNSWFLIDEATSHGFLIDPGAEGERLERIADERGWTIEAVLLTHGHMDHFMGLSDSPRLASLPVWIHEADLGMLSSPYLNLSGPAGFPFTFTAARPLADGAVIALDADPSFSVKFIHTPGHTPGSSVIVHGGDAFTGDTIFAGSVGATHFPGGDGEALRESVSRLLGLLPAETALHPGHMEETTLEVEAPFLRRFCGQ